MNETIAGIIAVLVGCALMLWRERFARNAIEEQNRLFGYRFGEREVRRTKLVAIVVGTGFVVWGLLVLSGVWEFRS